MNRKLFILMFVIFYVVCAIKSPQVFSQEQPIKVYIDGEQLSFSEEPFIEKDVTLVQFRPIFEKLGLKIEWDAETKTIVGRKDDLIIKLTIGSDRAIVNDEVKTLVLAPRIVNGNTMVPLRFVSESSGKDVKWDGTSREINIGNTNTVSTIKETIPLEDTIIDSTLKLDDYLNKSFSEWTYDTTKEKVNLKYSSIGNFLNLSISITIDNIVWSSEISAEDIIKINGLMVWLAKEINSKHVIAQINLSVREVNSDGSEINLANGVYDFNSKIFNYTIFPDAKFPLKDYDINP